MACTYDWPSVCNKRPLLKKGQTVYVVVERFTTYEVGGCWSARLINGVVKLKVLFADSDMFMVDPNIVRHPYLYKDRGITWFKTKGEARRAQRRKENER